MRRFFFLLIFPLLLQSVEYRFLTEKYIDDAAEVITLAFTQKPGCPMTRFQKISHDEFILFAKSVCQKSLEHHISLIALDSEEVVGALITLPGSIDPTPENYNHEKFAPILSVLEELDTPSFLIEGAHHFFLAVKPEFQKRKIGRELLLTSDMNLKELGYEFSFAEAATPMAQKLFQNLGYDSRMVKIYQSHFIDGKRPFEGIDEFYGSSSPLSCQLMIRSL